MSLGHVAGLVRAPRPARAAADPARQAPARPRRRAGALGERERRVGVQTSAPGLASAVLMATGIRVRHSRNCTSRDGGRCSCKPTYQAQAYDTRTGRQVWRTFPTLSAAKLWRQDAQVALRRGTMRPPTAKTIAEAAEVLIKGAHDGTILDRAGKPYKPSTARGYEQLLRAYVIPALGGWKLSELQRRDVQDFVDGLRSQGLSPSTIANILDPLRVIFRRAIRRDEVALDPTENLDLPAIRGRRDRIEPPEVAHELLAALPDYREGVLGGRAVLRSQTRRAARPPVDQRRLRQRRDPRRALMGPGQGSGRRQDRRRPPRRPDGLRRPPRAHGPQAAHATRRPGPRLRPHQDRGVLRLHDPRPRQQGVDAKPGSSRSRRTRRATARSPTSSPPASTGSRSPPGPDTATSARPGTATGTSSPAAKSKPESAWTPT